MHLFVFSCKQDTPVYKARQHSGGGDPNYCPLEDVLLNSGYRDESPKFRHPALSFPGWRQVRYEKDLHNKRLDISDQGQVLQETSQSIIYKRICGRVPIFSHPRKSRILSRFLPQAKSSMAPIRGDVWVSGHFYLP
jgi:hypothetical protein